MFGTRSVVASVFALAMYALPAQAVSIDDPTVRLLTNNFLFSASVGGGIPGTPDLPPGAFDVTYHFNYLPPPTLVALETTTNNIIGFPDDPDYSISGFLVHWIQDGVGELASFAGGTSNNSLSLPAAGLYTLRLTGIADGNAGGFFNVTVAARCAPGGSDCAPGETPLPGAVLLFGSVVAGVGGLQIARRRRKTQVA